MRQRALVHFAGPPDAGKTTFIERLLEAEVALAICIRAHHDRRLQTEHESAPMRHAELHRYRRAGAAAVALYRFGEPDTDAFFTSNVMEEYSDAVFIEGDCPIEFVDLSVFIAPPPSAGRSILRRAVRGRSTAPAERWALEQGYAGLERAQLVIVNLRSGEDPTAAHGVVDEIARLREDDEVRHDVLGLLGSRVPITAVVADVSKPTDIALKKAMARVKRAIRRVGE